MDISWVTLDRFCQEEADSKEHVRRELERTGRLLRSSADPLSDDELLAKLRDLGLDVDRDGVERLCEGALSVEEVARPIVDKLDLDAMTVDWVWICLVALWQRWWPDRACLESLDDKMQAGYALDEGSNTHATAVTWLSAWSDVLRLCDATGIGSIEEFDDRFPLTQSVFNWVQDLEMVLENAGQDNDQMRQALIDFCEESLRRFPREDQMVIENRRRALAGAYFDAGLTEKADGLFGSWLDADPGWGWGWIGWADCYNPLEDKPKDLRRAEKILRRGYRVPGVRDRSFIADRLEEVCGDSGRPDEARRFGEQARRLRREPSRPPLPALSAPSPSDGARTVKVGRNALCPCGSGKKFKKCCGSPLVR